MSRVDWDERYRQAGFIYGTSPNDFLVSVVDSLPMGKVLSLAEGEGRNGVYLASLGYSVTGVDGSATGLEKAVRLAAERGVSFTPIVADLSDFTIMPETWDGIVSLFCHLPSALRVPLHRRVVGGLKPGGTFILEAFSKEQLGRDTGGPPSLDMLMDLDELMVELKGLDFIHARRVERDVREGRCHNGPASVVQLLGVKPLKQA